MQVYGGLGVCFGGFGALCFLCECLMEVQDTKMRGHPNIAADEMCRI
ncbi:hypothetical protein Hanom_Chr00s000357g01638871 [Helianthus anomalus]